MLHFCLLLSYFFREFAIVILCALCTISEPTCYVVAAESPAVHYLVAFLEMGDANMHQVCSVIILLWAILKTAVYCEYR